MTLRATFKAKSCRSDKQADAAQLRAVLPRFVCYVLVLASLGLAGGVSAQIGNAETDNSPADDAQGSAFSALLAGWIADSRDAAILAGAQPMPDAFQREFAGYVPAEVLSRVRWRVDSGSSLLGALFHAGSARAVTLDHIIVFSTQREAENIRLWAHELYHVMQYERWGVDEFARRYLADRRSVESDAREFRWSWMKATGRVPGRSSGGSQRPAITSSSTE